MFRKISHLVAIWSFRFGIRTLLVVLLMQVASQSDWSHLTALAQGDGATAQASEGQAPSGTLVQAQFTDQPAKLTGAEKKALRKALNQSHRTGPDVGAELTVDAPPDDGISVEALPGSPDAASTFTIFRNTTLPVAAVGGAWSNASYTQEPSTGANGKNVFHTANWYATRSTNNGGAWTYVNPSTIFGKHPTGNIGFCCDQVTLYDPIHDRQWWVLQYGVGNPGQGGLKIANSSGSSLFTGWCFWDINATWFGYANATDAGVDYNDMAVSKNYVYIASNLFPSTGGQLSGVLRLPIDPLISCSAFSYSRYRDTSHFTFKLVQGAHRTMYWGSNWANSGGWTCGGCVNGNAFRVYAWPEGSGSVSFWDRTIDAFVFYQRNTGQNCASASGTVKNWCQFSDSRTLGGALSEGVLYFTFNAKQTTNRPFPYTRWVRFNESNKAYAGYWDLFSQTDAIQFLSISPNNDGAIGGTFNWGGGTGTTNHYPGGGLLLLDDYTTSVGNAWTNGINLFLSGGGNPCTSQGFYRWGDFLTARPFYPAGYAFIAGNYAIKGANCGTTGSFAEPHNVVFGRGRDQAEYDRWKNQ